MPIDEAALKDRLAATLLPALGLSGESFTLRPPSNSGTRSSLLVVEGRNLPRLLVRAFRRRTAAGRNVAALQHLEALDLPAPRLVFQDLALGARLVSLGGGLPYLTVETWIDGTRVVDLERPGAYREALPMVAALLARFHEVRRSTWGRPSRSRSSAAYAAHTLRQVRATLRRIERRGWLSASETNRVLAGFEAWRETIATIDSFSLLHKDANPGNFILSPEKVILPVDLHRIGYGPFQEDLVTALDHFCSHDREWEAVLRESYFKQSKSEMQEEFTSTQRFFKPLYFLKKLALRTQEFIDPERTPELRQGYCEQVLAIEPPG